MSVSYRRRSQTHTTALVRRKGGEQQDVDPITQVPKSRNGLMRAKKKLIKAFPYVLRILSYAISSSASLDDFTPPKRLSRGHSSYVHHALYKIPFFIACSAHLRSVKIHVQESPKPLGVMPYPTFHLRSLVSFLLWLSSQAQVVKAQCRYRDTS